MTTTKSVPENMLDDLDAASQKLATKSAPESGKTSDQPMTIRYSDTGPESPLAEAVETAKGAGAYSGDYWGTFSLEKFYSAGSLTYTHEDAWGWLKYLEKFHPRNFRYLDEYVRIWAYYEQYDNWQDTYGMDAVMAVYHSGHGGMQGNGRFHVPLGHPWGGLGTTAWSHKMRLGNEQVRYIFWSTCLSLRVLGGHNPIRTWKDANLGFRMLFGYETVSWDDPDYGSAFWKHWNKGQSFSTAFMNASWHDVSHNQTPSVVACGATKDEAKNRVFNERLLNWSAVSSNWWWWRWLNAASSATAARAPSHRLPDEVLVADLRPISVDGNYVNSILAKHNIGIGLPREVVASRDGTFAIRQGDMRLAMEGDGTYEIQYARPNLDNHAQIDPFKARGIAENFVQQQGLETCGLTFDRIMLSNEGGGTTEGSGELVGPFVTETTVQFTQEINGLPVLFPGKGYVSVTIDNDGSIVNLANSARTVEGLSSHPRTPISAPDEETPIGTDQDPEQRLAAAWQQQMRGWMLKDKMPVGFAIVPNSYEIGYAMRGNEAILLARQAMEVDFGGGYLKRYWVEAPILA